MLKHGRKAKSFFKYGLQIIENMLLKYLATLFSYIFSQIFIRLCVIGKFYVSLQIHTTT